MNINGYELTSDWKVSNIGHTAKATKGGKKYFLKRYGEYKMPRHDSSTSAALYTRMEREFNSFMENRVAINKALESLAGMGGNIILPTKWFVDDIFYIEATEFVENLIEDEDILKLPLKNKLFIMLTAAGALHNIHRKNIVHSDLKRTNILAAKNASGNTVAKIIDFDRSYFADNIRPDELGGDQNFMSPELVQCFMYDMADEALEYLSTKSDIFSLGLVFHDYLVGGAHPKIEGLTGALKDRADSGKTVYCGEAVLSGAKLVVSDKIEDEYLRHLIAAMIQAEPDDRPAAQEVLEVLKTKRVLPLKADGSSLIEGESAPTPAPTPTPTPTPTATEETHEEESEIVGFCEAWAEHKISLNIEKLTASGYVAAAQTDRKGVKCYTLKKRDGSTRIFSADNLVMLGLATRAGASTAKPAAKKEEEKPATETVLVDDGELWEEDNAFKFDLDRVKVGGYTGITKAERKGIKGYVLIKADGQQRFMNASNLKMLSFIVKK